MVEDSKLGQNTTRASRRALKTRRRLLDAALLVFGDLGVESCTVENITERADLGKGTFYRHFEDKAALIRTLLEMAVDQLIERMPRPEKSRPLDDAVDQIIRAHIAFYMDFTTTYAFLLQNQLTARSRRGIALMHDEPLLRYIVAIESQLSAVRATADNPRRLRMAACALAGSTDSSATTSTGGSG